MSLSFQIQCCCSFLGMRLLPLQPRLPPLRHKQSKSSFWNRVGTVSVHTNFGTIARGPRIRAMARAEAALAGQGSGQRFSPEEDNLLLKLVMNLRLSRTDASTLVREIQDLYGNTGRNISSFDSQSSWRGGPCRSQNKRAATYLLHAEGKW